MNENLTNQIVAALLRDGTVKMSAADLSAALAPAVESLDKEYRFLGLAKPAKSPAKIYVPTLYAAVTAGSYPGFSKNQVDVGDIHFYTSDDGAEWDDILVHERCACTEPEPPTPPTPGPDLKQSLTFEALNDNTTINFYYDGDPGDEKTIEVSTDGGQTWTEKTASAEGTALATLGAGERLLVRGNNAAYSDNENFQNFFHATGDAYVYGNIMSLISSEGFDELDEVGANSFANLFYDWNETVTGDWLLSKNDSPLLLPATTIAESCYAYMFSFCTGLTAAPELPATTLAANCYESMFEGCTKLTTAPELPATTLAESCYGNMFAGCTGLTAAPELPATILAESCYNYMFAGCTGLTAAPELPATTLAERCYGDMFGGCANLAYIKALFTTSPSIVYTSDWVLGVAANGTFVKSADATWNVTGNNGVPTGWIVETA